MDGLGSIDAVKGANAHRDGVFDEVDSCERRSTRKDDIALARLEIGDSCSSIGSWRPARATESLALASTGAAGGRTRSFSL